ncbi:hypothetical protein [Paenibacillus daejeonensis]|uniref:hypothetical protein n=1 Tax=Paenibacillus daejeonensis TaxID=135193 RepID=UPI00037A6E25|nr:hypothetical protein [Paenibacillus daejeonensis]
MKAIAETSHKVEIERVSDNRVEQMKSYFVSLRDNQEHDPYFIHTLQHVLAGYHAAWDEVERLREQLAEGAEAAQRAIEQLKQASEVLRALKQDNPIMTQARRYIAGQQGPEASES